MPTVDILVAVGFRGGVENVINTTAKYLDSSGFHVRIINLLWIGKFWTDENLEFHALIDVNKEQWNNNFEYLSNKYSEFLDQNGVPDIILATGWPKLVPTAKAAVAKTGLLVPIVSWLHSTIETYIKMGLGGYEELSHADAHFAINKKIAEKIRHHIEGSKVYTITNPIDKSKLVYSENRDSLKLAFVGRLAPEKNIPFLLSSLSKAGPDWTLELVGDGDPDGSSMNTLKEYCKSLKISDRVTFHGWLDNPWEVLTDCKALVLTSDTESSSLVIVEALLCGMFVITTPTEGPLEKIRPGENGFIIPFNDEQFFIKVLDMIKNNQFPPITPMNCRRSMEHLLGDEVLLDFMQKLTEVIKDSHSKVASIVKENTALKRNCEVLNSQLENAVEIISYYRHVRDIYHEKYKKDSPWFEGKGVVYMSITGGYDEIPEPLEMDKSLDYVLLTDSRPKNYSGSWDVRIIDNPHSFSAPLLSRYNKMHPFEIFPDYDWSIYVDGSIQIKRELSSFIRQYQKDNSMICFAHHCWSTIDQEANAIVENNKATSEELDKQISKYRSDGFKNESFITETGFLVRSHHDPLLKKVMDDWWTELLTYDHHRDQMSFCYSCWKNNYEFDLCDLLIFDNPWFRAVKVH